MTRLLVEAGEALYGPQWQSALARDLAVSDRTVRRWAAGTHPMPHSVLRDLLRLTVGRGRLLAEIGRRLERSADPE